MLKIWTQFAHKFVCTTEVQFGHVRTDELKLLTFLGTVNSWKRDLTSMIALWSSRNFSDLMPHFSKASWPIMLGKVSRQPTTVNNNSSIHEAHAGNKVCFLALSASSKLENLFFSFHNTSSFTFSSIFWKLQHRNAFSRKFGFVDNSQLFDLMLFVSSKINWTNNYFVLTNEEKKVVLTNKIHQKHARQTSIRYSNLLFWYDPAHIGSIMWKA